AADRGAASLVSVVSTIRQRTGASVAAGHRLASELQTGTSSVEARAPAGACQTAKEASITWWKCQWLRASPSPAPQSRLELRLSERSYGGWPAVEAAGGDRRIHSRVPGCRSRSIVYSPGRDADAAVLVCRAWGSEAYPE